MLKVSEITGVVVFAERPDSKGRPSGKWARLGKVHQCIFSPEGDRVVGFNVKQRDVAGMIKRPDVFLALDSLRPCEGGIRATHGPASFDDVARERLGINWDECVIWTGMDAHTTDGKELGYVSDAEFNTKTGKVSKFFVGDGRTATALVGQVEIPASMLRGYKKKHGDVYMLVDPQAAYLELNGGAAARAGENYARAKYEGKKAAAKAEKKVDEAVDKGSHALGVGLGKVKKAADEARVDNVDGKPAPEIKNGQDAAKAFGKQIGALGGAFDSFKKEFKENSK